MATKRVTSSDLRINVKRVLNEVEYGAEHYIIEKFGEPSAAIISIEDFKFFQAIRAILDEVEQKELEEKDDNQKSAQDSANETPLDGSKRKMSQKEMVESLMKLLQDSDRIPEAAQNYMQNDLISKLLATLQYLEAQVSRLEAEMGIKQEENVSETEKEARVSGPHGAHWNQFVGALAGEEWERPPQGTIEVREAW